MWKKEKAPLFFSLVPRKYFIQEFHFFCIIPAIININKLISGISQTRNANQLSEKEDFIPI